MKKYYRMVQYIIMANKEQIDTIGTYVWSPEIAPKNIEEAMEDAEDIILAGWGIHSGRKLWQAPDSIQNEVREFLEKQALNPPPNLYERVYSGGV